MFSKTSTKIDRARTVHTAITYKQENVKNNSSIRSRGTSHPERDCTLSQHPHLGLRCKTCKNCPDHHIGHMVLQEYKFHKDYKNTERYLGNNLEGIQRLDSLACLESRYCHCHSNSCIGNKIGYHKLCMRDDGIHAVYVMQRKYC